MNVPSLDDLKKAEALFGRRAKLTIAYPLPGNYVGSVQLGVVTINGDGDPNVPGLRIKFKICKSKEKEPNNSEIRVYNLSEATRRAIQTKGANVVLEAGYAGTGVTTIFSGNIRTVDHMQEGPDWVSVIKCGDGDRSFRYARVNASFGPGASAGEILRTIAAATGLNLGNAGAVAGRLQSFRFQHGYTITGSAQRALSALLGALGYSWSVQNGALQVLAPGQVLDVSIPLISPTTGLIGSPEMGSPETKGKPALCKFKSLLIATVPGAAVHLKSDRYDTDVIVNKCEMEGDTKEGPWFTVIFGILRTS